MSSVGIPRAQGREQRQDLQCLRSITRRYNEQIGVQQNRTNFSREAKNPETPFRAVLKEDLLIGNWVLGSKRTEILRATEGQIWSKRQISDPLGRYKEPGERETEVNLCMSA